jgi:hypothetical protein
MALPPKTIGRPENSPDTQMCLRDHVFPGMAWLEDCTSGLADWRIETWTDHSKSYSGCVSTGSVGSYKSFNTAASRRPAMAKR